MRQNHLCIIENLYPIALEKWGSKAQTIKTLEELAELQVQLCKVLNGSPTTTSAIVDEIADVLIMVNQMRLQYGLNEVDDRVLYKLQRLAKALAK